MKRILYYSWNENSCQDCVNSMRSLGHNVDVIKHPIKNYTKDDEFSSFISSTIKKGYDLIFTFNYFPLISNVANKEGVPYVFWVYDNPHYTLESDTLSNSCNHGYIFDLSLVQKYKNRGISTVNYLPLACNISRLEKLTSTILQGGPSYASEVSFIGSLYQENQDMYSQISYLPDYLKGYIAAIVQTQQSVYGLDLTDSIFTPVMCNTMSEYVKVGLGEGYNNNTHDLLKDIIRKHITAVERDSLLDAVGLNHKLDLYSNQKSNSLHVNFKGIAENYNQMPKIFASSKINLNITLRTIKTGIPLRVIEIIGAGGFCLSNYQAELCEFFTLDQDMVCFESKEDLLDKCSYYLSHDSERQAIARRSNEKAKKYFDYSVLLPKLLDI